MMTERNSSVQTTTEEKLWTGATKLVAALKEAKLHDVADRADHLATRLKEADRRVRIAFCGLFSAGKSSLVNALVGDQQLATGAVPTTAAVEEVVWQTSTGPLVLMDTPGIDSTDDAHQEATDAAMHLADIACLVVDYQHVEAEENLEFARQLSERGKRLFLIVNQVDKHLDFELDFQAFRARSEQVMEDEGILFEKIFYVSTRPSKYSELDALRQSMTDLAQDAELTVISSIRASLLGLIDEAVEERYADDEWETDAALLSHFERAPFDLQEAEEWMNELDGQLQQRTVQEKAAETEIWAAFDTAENEFERSIELGQVAPYGTTELGRLYAESLSSEFKVGWFGVEKKTREERDRRRDAFLADLQKQLNQNLLWPLQREVRDFVHNVQGGNPDMLAEVDGLSAEVTAEMLQEVVNPGAVGSEAYPYQYVKDVVQRLKSDVRRKMREQVEAWRDDVLREEAAHRQETDEDGRLLREKYDALQAWLALRNAKAQQRTEWSDDLA